MGFRTFSLQHLVTVAGLAAAIAAMCLVGRTLHGSPAGRRYERALALAVATFWVSYQVYDRVRYGFDPRYALPLQFCDLVAIVAAIAFAFPGRLGHALAYFWGLALSTQAVFTPDLAAGPTTLAFWAFWAYHMFVVGAGVYVVVVRGFRPAWPDLVRAAAIGVLYVAIVFVIDAVFDLNYGYLGRATPAQPTLLDVLGPWPQRVLFMVLLGVAGMTVFWLPWALARIRDPKTLS